MGKDESKVFRHTAVATSHKEATQTPEGVEKRHNRHQHSCQLKERQLVDAAVKPGGQKPPKKSAVEHKPSRQILLKKELCGGEQIGKLRKKFRPHGGEPEELRAKEHANDITNQRQVSIGFGKIASTNGMPVIQQCGNDPCQNHHSIHRNRPVPHGNIWKHDQISPEYA